MPNWKSLHFWPKTTFGAEVRFANVIYTMNLYNFLWNKQNEKQFLHVLWNEILLILFRFFLPRCADALLCAFAIIKTLLLICYNQTTFALIAFRISNAFSTYILSNLTNGQFNKILPLRVQVNHSADGKLNFITKRIDLCLLFVLVQMFFYSFFNRFYRFEVCFS